MDNEQAILERLDRIEKQIAPLSDSATSLRELREDMAPRVNEAVHALITEMADVEADFQLEDLTFLIKKSLRSVKNLTFALDQLKNLIDFALTAEPLLKSTVPQIIFFFDELEQKGVFTMLNTMLETAKKMAETFTPEDFEQMGEGLITLLGTGRKLGTPEAMAFLDKAAELPGKVDLSKANATGPLGMLWAMGNKEAREGLGVLVELTKGMAALKA